MTLSRPDIVFNVAAGAASSDTAAVAITASSGDLARLRVAIRYAEAQDHEWLTVLVDRSVAPAALRFRTRTESLAAGEYTATVQLTAPGLRPDSVTVTARVVAGASIGLNAARICFTTRFNDGSLPRDDVRVTSVDGSPIEGLTATIDYDAGQPGGWLATSFVSTSAPTRLWLHGTPGALPVGTYHATVRVSAAGAGISPVSIRVTLTVNEFEQPPPGQQSIMNVRLVWDGPTYGAVATVLGQVYPGGPYDIFCRGGTTGCTGILESGIGEVLMGPLTYGGARFLRWEGACAGQIFGCTVRFDSPGTTREATAVFGTLPATIAVVLQGTGSGTITLASGATPGQGVPLSCNPICRGTIDGGVGTFTLTAVPSPGSVFAGWQLAAGDPESDPFASCHGTAPSCTVSLASGGNTISGVAAFVPASPTGDRLLVTPMGLGVVLPTDTVAIHQGAVIGPMPPVGGTITGPGIDCRLDNGAVTGDCEERMTPGTEIRLVRTPAPGASCTPAPASEQPGDCEIVVTGRQGDLAVAAEFFTQLNSIQVRMAGTGTGVAGGPSCFLVDGVESEEGPIPPGEKSRCFIGHFGTGEVPYRAETLSTHPGTEFVRWTGDCEPNSGRPPDYCVVRFTGSGREATITAHFARSP